MKTIVGLFAVLLLLVILVAALKYLPVNGKSFFGFSKANHQATAEIGNHTINLLIANDDKAKQIGLSGRDSLAQDTGMIFPFDHADYYGFWMHDMRFPLDILYLRSQHIISIFQNVPNPTFPTENTPVLKPEEPADTVIELNAGTAKKYNLKKGDSIKISL